MMDITKIKLVIWDLDDTFWNGTLSEEESAAIEENVYLVKRLAERGIVSSICSKNDLDQAQQALTKMNIWDYFVFPSINWEPKGQRIAGIINAMALRPVNVLFIDDLPANLREAEFFNPGLMTALPRDMVPELMKAVDTLATELRQDVAIPDWITKVESLDEDGNQKENNRKLRILFKGSCDTESSPAFLKGSGGIDTEFTFVNAKGYVISSQNSTFYILESLQGRQLAESYRIAIPFWDEQLYKTCMFAKHYDIVF